MWLTSLNIPLQIVILLLLHENLHSQKDYLFNLTNDTIQIEIMYPMNNRQSVKEKTLKVIDNRGKDERVIDIRHYFKWAIVPVDEHITLTKPLGEVFHKIIGEVQEEGTIYINQLDIWYDPNTIFSNGYVLNAQTTYYNIGKRIDMEWEIRQKNKKSQYEKSYKYLIKEWIERHKSAINESAQSNAVQTTRYKRQFNILNDVIFLPNGYIVNPSIFFDYPFNGYQTYTRGIDNFNVFYRKTDVLDSFALMERGQRWVKRINHLLISQYGCSLYLGVNRLNYDSLRSYNIFYNLFLHIGGYFNFQYNPTHNKGLYFGIGYYQAFDPWPDIIKKFSYGLKLSIGYSRQ